MRPRALYISLFFMSACTVPSLAVSDCVVLLHGLARSANSMSKMEARFDQLGYQVVKVGYPSRDLTIEQLAPMAVRESGFGLCQSDTVHFVTHSMGGILVRYFLEHNPPGEAGELDVLSATDTSIRKLGRVVMLAPPNKGSQVVDRMRNVPGFKWLNGEAGLQLGTDEKSIPSQLGPVDYELGIIAGTKTFNPMLSQLLPNPDDGKVSVANTKVEGMTDHLVVKATHTFMMRSNVVIDQTVHFIENGEFER